MLTIILTSIDFNIKFVRFDIFQGNIFFNLLIAKPVEETIGLNEAKHNSPCMTIVIFIDMMLLIIGQVFIHVQTAEILNEDLIKSPKGNRLLNGIGIIGIIVCINSILMLNPSVAVNFFYNNLLNGVLVSIVVPLIYIYQNPKMSEYIKTNVLKKCNNEVHPI